MPVREASLEHLAARALERAGYAHVRIYRCYPPRQAGGEAEILFRAALREGHRAGGPQVPYTAYLRDEAGAEPLVCSGW